MRILPKICSPASSSWLRASGGLPHAITSSISAPVKRRKIGSLSWAVDKVKANGAHEIIALCVVAAPAGVERMEQDHPDVRVVTAGLDRGLNDSYYIEPGLGDMGDRLFGTL